MDEQMQDRLNEARAFLRQHAVDGMAMPQREYNERKPLGMISSYPIANRIGWSEFVRSAGLEPRQRGGSRSDFGKAIELCQTIQDRDGCVSFTAYMDERSQTEGRKPAGKDAIRARYGSWSEFLESHGFVQTIAGRPTTGKTGRTTRRIAAVSEETQARIVADLFEGAQPVDVTPLRLVGIWEERRYYDPVQHSWYECEAAPVQFG